MLLSLVAIYFIVMEENILSEENTLKENKDILFECYPEPIAYKSKDLNYVFCNKNFSSLVDEDNEDILGKNDFDFFPFDIAKAMEKEDKLVFKNKRKLVTKKLLETKINSKGWFMMTKVPIFNKDREVKAIAVFYRDINKEIKNEEYKNDFTATLIHDLKLPYLPKKPCFNFC